jgi:hypothetical protein
MYSTDTKPFIAWKGTQFLDSTWERHSGNFQYLVFHAAPTSRYSEFTDVIRAYFMLERQRGTLRIRPCTDRRANLSTPVQEASLVDTTLISSFALLRNTNKPDDNDSEIPTVRHCTVRTINIVLLFPYIPVSNAPKFWLNSGWSHSHKLVSLYRTECETGWLNTCEFCCIRLTCKRVQTCTVQRAFQRTV